MCDYLDDLQAIEERIREKMIEKYGENVVFMVGYLSEDGKELNNISSTPSH